jgi:tRNA 2-thiocytidine biosynthesis protein TtcA
MILLVLSVPLRGKDMSKLHLHLRKRLEQAVVKHRMLSEGDRVLVGVSGGADSLALLKLLTGPLLFIPQPELVLAVYVDLGFAGANGRPALHLKQYFEEEGYRYRIKRTNIGPLAHSDFNRKASPCFLCSRLRRRELFELAREYRCNKIALAHNKDDVIETFLLNIFFAREISTMLPYQSFFKGDFYLMRPLAYIEESLLKRFAREASLPVVENPCPTARNTKRQYIKDLIKKLELDHRGLKENIFKSMKHVKPDYLL